MATTSALKIMMPISKGSTMSSVSLTLKQVRDSQRSIMFLTTVKRLIKLMFILNWLLISKLLSDSKTLVRKENILTCKLLLRLRKRLELKRREKRLKQLRMLENHRWMLQALKKLSLNLEMTLNQTKVLFDSGGNVKIIKSY